MKFRVNFLLFIFITFLSLPTIVGLIEKSCDTSIIFSITEEEQHKDVKLYIQHYSNPEIFFHIEEANAPIISEVLSRHDTISTSIVIPPPDFC